MREIISQMDTQASNLYSKLHSIYKSSLSPDTVKAFERSQATWIAYRDAQFDFSSLTEEKNRNLSESPGIKRRIEITEERISFFQILLSDAKPEKGPHKTEQDAAANP